MNNKIDDIIKWIDNEAQKASKDTLVVGVSGGIDSALTSTLCAKTTKKLIAVNMPLHQNPDQIVLSDSHIAWLQKEFNSVENLKIDLSFAYDEFINCIPSKYQNKLSSANSKARLRMMTLYQIAGSCNGIVVGTGNKVEDFGVGFFTKYGDGGVDISPIADLMKSEVYQLAKTLNISDSILKARPTDGLWDDGRTDEDQLGVSYDDLEWAMLYNGVDPITDKQKKILDTYNLHRNKNMHKMKNIPIFKSK